MAVDFLLSSCIAAFLLFISPAEANFESACLSFAPQKYVYNSTLEILEYVTNGTVLKLDDVASCARPNQTVIADFCRISLSVPTSNQSSISLEAWFPEQFSGRMLATGNGGLDGCIKYEELAYGVANGFGTLGTNNGHNGSSGESFLNNPDIFKNYAWRSVHTSAEVGKVLIRQFYDQNVTRSYYIGCSGGGRQGVKSTELFPFDFDGVFSGSPAVDFNNLYSYRATFYLDTGDINSVDFITSQTWSNLIHNEVLAQCDVIDGVSDGIIEDPVLCHFVPERILCGPNATAADTSPTSPSVTCLTSRQVSIVRQIFSPLLSANGSLVYPAMQPGSEILASQGLYAGVPWQLSEDYFRYVIFSDPTWDPASFNRTGDTTFANRLNPQNVRTWPSSLAKFRDRGGKLIMTHGQQDQQITSFNTPRFYERLSQVMGASPAELDEWYRFFRISGMGHCQGGPGPWVFGQSGASAAAGIGFEPQSNVLAALVNWVENGTAPSTILGTKFVNDTPALGIDFQRRHCRFPYRNTFIGGDYKLPESWECMLILNTSVTVEKRASSLEEVVGLPCHKDRP